MRVGVDIMQPYPGAELAQFLGEVIELRLDRPAAIIALGIFDIDAIGAGILADDQQFLDAGPDQAFGLAQNAGRRA